MTVIFSKKNLERELKLKKSIMVNYFDEIINKVLEWKRNNDLCKVPPHMIYKYGQIKPITKETLINDLIDFDLKYKKIMDINTKK
jgi:hypothetical protein